MKKSFIFFAITSALSIVLGPVPVALAQDGFPLARVNVLAWPRMAADQFGCMLEKTYGYRDKKFNCSLKDYKNNGDPCNAIDEYYEGIELPYKIAQKIYPGLDDVQLSWEHGELQSVSFSFNRKASREQLTKAFNLPDSKSYPANISDISIQDCSKLGTCLVITGFDHTGAGDVDCEEAGGE